LTLPPVYRSKQNTCIERLWREVGTCFARPWRAFFYRLEREHHLDRSSHHHLWLLHYLFLPDIRADCASFCEEWNAHPISGEGHDQSPNDMRFMGQLEHGIYLQNDIQLHPNVISHYYCLQHQGNGSTPGHLAEQDDEWEDVVENSDAATQNSDLPSMIAADQAPEFANDGAPVPKGVSPFPSPAWQEVFHLSMQQVQEIGHIPIGYGIREEEWDGEGYPELETIPSGHHGQKEIIVELPEFIWRPRALRWCQAMEVL
ncbi:hypothetical protein BKA82DRAFT_4448126, partial [Pisolithus tinctorius]